MINILTFDGDIRESAQVFDTKGNESDVYSSEIPADMARFFQTERNMGTFFSVLFLTLFIALFICLLISFFLALFILRLILRGPDQFLSLQLLHAHGGPPQRHIRDIRQPAHALKFPALMQRAQYLRLIQVSLFFSPPDPAGCPAAGGSGIKT